MLLPHFLVIGAMKSGTTSLYHDLGQHPDIVLAQKELSALTRPSKPGIADAYRAAFARARPGATLGDVSTTYSMHPHLADVSERARSVLCPATKIVYLVRDPVARIISHHHHDLSIRRSQNDIDTAVRTDPRFLDFTRYASQARPWVEAFGDDALHVVCFEEYARNRASVVREIFDFLGVPAPAVQVDTRVHNKSQGKSVAVGGWARMAANPVYRQVLRPLLPDSFRGRLMHSVLPTAPTRPRPPAADTISLIWGEIGPEVKALRQFTNAGMWWQPPGAGGAG